MPYAHALIELENGDLIERGEEVTGEIEGYDELVEGGSISDEEYDPAQDEVGPPETVVIDGITYVQASDGARSKSGTKRNTDA